TLANERIAHNDIHENAREGFQESVKSLKQKYTNAQLEEQERQSHMQNDFKADVEDRIDSQVNRLKREVGRSKDRVAMAEHEARVKAKREIENVREAYQKNIDHLENGRKELLNQHNEI